MKKNYILLLFLPLPILAGPEIVNYYPDDAYFYLEIAKNISHGNGITFGGVLDTNGFHPLWLLSLVPISYLFPEESSFLLAVYFTHILLSGIAIYIFLEKTKTFISEYAYLSVIPLSGILFCTGLVGTESSLSALTIVSSFYFLYVGPKKDYSYKRSAAIGVFLGLMMLSRLDTFFIGGLACLYLLYFAGIKRSILTFLTCSILVLPYIFFNMHEFGHLTPISGAVKSTFPHVGSHLGNTSIVHEVTAVGSLVSLPFVVSKAKNKRIKGIAIVLVIGSFLQFIYHFLFSTSSSWYWYSVQASIALGVCIPFVSHSMLPNLEDAIDFIYPKKVTLSILSLFVIVSSIYIIFKNYEERSEEMIESVKAIEGQVSDSSVVLAGDLPGMLAYYSDFKVVAVDGLTNNYEYFRRLRECGVAVYRKIGITHIFWRRGSRNSGVMQLECELGEWADCKKGQLKIYNRLHNDEFAGSIPITARSRLVNIKMPNVTEHFTLWRYHP